MNWIIRNLLPWGVALTAIAFTLWLGQWGIRTLLARRAIAAIGYSATTNQQIEANLKFAAHMRPDLSRIWRLRARAIMLDDPQNAQQAIRRAIALDPKNWRNWHQLGMIEFQLDHLRQARNALQQAVRFNSGFAAHFAAANLAYILGDQARFWSEMKSAIQVAPVDEIRPVLYNLIRLGGNHPGQLLQILPLKRTRIAVAANEYLTERHQLSTATRIWDLTRCPSYRRKDCKQAATELIHAWLMRAWVAERTARQKTGIHTAAMPARRGKARTGALQASRIWKQAIARKVFEATPVLVGAFNDGRFKFNSGEPFSWQSGSIVPVLSPSRNPIKGMIASFTLDGFESSHVDLFWQWLLVQPGACYQVQFESRGAGMQNPQGIHLALDLPQQHVLASVSAKLGATWHLNRGEVKIPERVHLLQARIAYDRPFGISLLSGRVQLRDFRLTTGCAGPS